MKPRKLSRFPCDFMPKPRWGQSWAFAFAGLIVASASFDVRAQCPSVGTVIYVDATASPGGNGATWTCAYSNLTTAINAAFSAGTITEMRIADGTYKPATVGNPSVSFHLVNNCVIKGGYAGIGAANPNARDIVAFETILSGDLAGNDPTTTDNSNTVLTGSQTDNSAATTSAILTASQSRVGKAALPAMAQVYTILTMQNLSIKTAQFETTSPIHRAAACTTNTTIHCFA